MDNFVSSKRINIYGELETQVYLPSQEIASRWPF